MKNRFFFTIGLLLYLSPLLIAMEDYNEKRLGENLIENPTARKRPRNNSDGEKEDSSEAESQDDTDADISQKCQKLISDHENRGPCKDILKDWGETKDLILLFSDLEKLLYNTAEGKYSDDESINQEQASLARYLMEHHNNFTIGKTYLTLLAQAALYNNRQLLKFLLTIKTNSIINDKSLLQAILLDDKEAVSTCLANCCCTDFSVSFKISIANYLIEKVSPLSVAVLSGKFHIASLIFKHDLDHSKTDACDNACYFLNFNVHKSQRYYNSALGCALLRYQETINHPAKQQLNLCFSGLIKFLIMRGARFMGVTDELPYRTCKFIIWAIKSNNIDWLSKILEETPRLLEAADGIEACNALSLICRSKYFTASEMIQAITLLVKEGTNLQCEGEGFLSPLAAIIKNTTLNEDEAIIIIDILLKAGAQINEYFDIKDSPLSIAKKYNKELIVSYLLKHGA